ncbi:3-carboxymuconate cyclase [Enemella evansiae]|uniref:lactonase family protein n=1 Tax=Enemella evansiae TaxID=2016499 RepID=UPI000B96C741|nr:beta-propeller fold lactonase family protein [Enemella evansiae]OYN98272.1 3-carboxymuconate cyclase [Enemella evansiae]
MTDARTPEVAYIGCYTSTADGHGLGIQPLRTGDGTALDPAPAVDPSFLIAHPRLPVLYAVSERESSALTAYQIRDDGTLQLLNALDTGGNAGCHLAFDAERDLLVVAHYTDGSVAICSVAEDGSLGQVTDFHRFTGQGPDPQRQDGSHAHMAIRDGDDWLIADLGADRIHRLSLDDDGRIGRVREIVTPPGVGPRHLIIDGDALVLACELSAELWLARRDGDGWEGAALVPSTAIDTGEAVYPSGIAWADDRVVVANRGADTIATFRLDRDQNTLRLVDERPTGGRWPRDLTWSDGRLWVANQNSDSVTVFEPRGDGWRLVETFEVSSPACVRMVD